MSEMFTVTLDLSAVIKDKRANQLYVVLRSVELFYENAALHDFDDIRVLSLLNVVQVRMLECSEKEKNIEKRLISKINEFHDKYENESCQLLFGEIGSKYFFTDVGNNDVANDAKLFERDSELGSCQKNYDSYKFPIETGEKSDRIEKTKEPLWDRTCSQQNDNIMTAENLKLALLMQRKYYQQYTNCCEFDLDQGCCYGSNKVSRNLEYKSKKVKKLREIDNGEGKTKQHISGELDKVPGKIMHVEGICLNQRFINGINDECYPEVHCFDQFSKNNLATNQNLSARGDKMTQSPGKKETFKLPPNKKESISNSLCKPQSVRDALQLLMKTVSDRKDILSSKNCVDPTPQTGSKKKRKRKNFKSKSKDKNKNKNKNNKNKTENKNIIIPNSNKTEIKPDTNAKSITGTEIETINNVAEQCGSIEIKKKRKKKKPNLNSKQITSLSLNNSEKDPQQSLRYKEFGNLASLNLSQASSSDFKKVELRVPIFSSIKQEKEFDSESHGEESHLDILAKCSTEPKYVSVAEQSCEKIIIQTSKKDYKIYKRFFILLQVLFIIIAFFIYTHTSQQF